MSFNPDYFYTLGYKARALFEYYNHSPVGLSADISIPFNSTAYTVGLLNNNNDQYACMVQADFPNSNIYVEFDNGDPISDPGVYLLVDRPLEGIVEKFAGYLNIPVPVLPDLSTFTPVHVGMRPTVHSGIRIIVRAKTRADLDAWCTTNNFSTDKLVGVDSADGYEVSFDLIDGRITNPTVLYAVNNNMLPVNQNSWYQSAVAHGRGQISKNYANVVLIDRDPMVKVSLSTDLPDDYLKVYLMALPKIQ